MGGKGGGAGGLEVVGSIMKMLGGLLGRKATPEVAPRGFLGLELEDGPELPAVKAVLEGGPAAKAGVKPGDRLSHIQGRSVLNTEDVLRLARRVLAGDEVTVTVVRGKETREIRFTAGEGF
jgi:serine protease DegQ